MREVIDDIAAWLQENDTPVGLATVVNTWGSAPRRAGAKLAFTADGRLAGSVSGGCVEGAVIEAGQDVLRTGQPVHLSFGVADETAWEVGLACGGTIEVFVEALDRDFVRFARATLDYDETAAVVTIIADPEGSIGQKLALNQAGETLGTLDNRYRHYAAEAIASGQAPARIENESGVVLFVDVWRPRPTLVMVGGGHIAIALASMAAAVGYRTVIVDPRRIFGNTLRFPEADLVLPVWPKAAFETAPLTRETAVVTLSHDPKIDDPALAAALESPAFYVGALGSSQSHGRRVERLSKKGIAAATIERIRGPVGLDIGAANPEEIALSVMAEVVQAWRATEAA
jgi:xanthine dehydrogenase accessory factor